MWLTTHIIRMIIGFAVCEFCSFAMAFLLENQKYESKTGLMSDKVKILVVEDEMPVALMMTFLLTRVGYDVTTARNGQEGLELATRQKFDLITLDMDLPDIKGIEICRELKQRHISRNTPIIFVTGQPHAENRQRALELGAVDYIEKPFEMSDFIFRIATHVRKSQEHGMAAIQN